MDRSRAAFEAFDGIEIELVDGQVVRVPGFSVAEAMGYIRKFYRLTELEEGAIEASEPRETRAYTRARDDLISELVARLGLSAVPAASIDFRYDGPDGTALEWGDLTVGDLRAMASLILDAGLAEDEGDQALAQIRWLGEAPGTFGIDATAVSPTELISWGFQFQEAFYRYLYGLASDFYSRLHQAPMVKAWKIRSPTATLTSGAGAAT